MANGAVGPGRNGGAQQISEETLRELLSVQKQEIALRLKEVERDSSEISLNKSVAQQSIEAQERDRKHNREEQTRRQQKLYVFILALVCIVLAFAGWAMHEGQAALVLDLVKVVLGFVGGMGLQAYLQRRPQQDSGE